MDASTNKFLDIKWLRSVLYFICGSNLIITVPNIFLVWFQCSPPNALWDITRQHDCNPKPQIFYSYFLGAYAALSDFILAGLSIHTIYARHTLPLRTKLLASLLMGLGFLACAAAIARTYYSQQLLEGDMTYNAATLYQVGKIEEWGVLIGGCIPAVWPVMVEIWNKISCFSGRRRTPRGGVAWTGPGERVVGEYGLWGAISNFFGNFFHRMKTGLSGKGTRFATTGGIQSYTTGPDHQDPYASTEIMLQPMYPQHNSKGEEIRPERDNEGDMVPPVDFTPRPPVQSSGWTGENYGRQGLINTAEGFNPLRSNPVTVVQRKGHSSKGSEGENTEHTQRTTPASSLRERSEFESL
ncbi:MAG: hypothetical protein M1831_006843 [Alyxoria varia]|nr:MAG: hypothetical protein M1831_006843 [Alyxoria varia]